MNNSISRIAMKICTTVFILFCAVQNVNSQTTQQEYNYITQSYKYVEEAGMDVKQGYSVSVVTKASSEVPEGKVISKRQAWLKVFQEAKDGSTKRTAAYIIVYQKDNGAKQYFCVPAPNSDNDITQKFFNALHDGIKNSSSSLQLICVLLARGLTW